jgi:hypothetical protein
MGLLATERFRTGNHARIYVSGPGGPTVLAQATVSGPVGKGSALNFGAALGVRPLHMVGSAEPQDLVDGAHTYTVRLDVFTPRDEVVQDIRSADYVNIECMDQYNGATVAVATNCKLSDVGLNVPANNPLARNMTFQAMEVSPL